MARIKEFMTPEDVLTAFRESKALLSGHFELRSGLHSDQYFQCAKVLQDPRLTSRLCAALSELMTSAGIRADTIMAPAMGGLFVGFEIARTLGRKSIFAEKENGRLVLRRGFTVGEGESFIVAEDVITRGGRVQETIDIVRAGGGRVAAVAVLVDRSGGTVDFGAPTFRLLEMTPQVWSPDQCPLCARGIPIEHPGSA